MLFIIKVIGIITIVFIALTYPAIIGISYHFYNKLMKYFFFTKKEKSI